MPIGIPKIIPNFAPIAWIRDGSFYGHGLRTSKTQVFRNFVRVAAKLEVPRQNLIWPILSGPNCKRGKTGQNYRKLYAEIAASLV